MKHGLKELGTNTRLKDAFTTGSNTTTDGFITGALRIIERTNSHFMMDENGGNVSCTGGQKRGWNRKGEN
jgi:hypothetical protein